MQVRKELLKTLIFGVCFFFFLLHRLFSCEIQLVKASFMCVNAYTWCTYKEWAFPTTSTNFKWSSKHVISFVFFFFFSISHFYFFCHSTRQKRIYKFPFCTRSEDAFDENVWQLIFASNIVIVIYHCSKPEKCSHRDIYMCVCVCNKVFFPILSTMKFVAFEHPVNVWILLLL